MALSIDATSRAQYFPTLAGKPAEASPGQAEQTGTEPSGDQAVFSAEGKRKAGANKTSGSEQPAVDQEAKQSEELAALRQRDREVRSHEQAHVAAGGNLVRGAASFGYKAGPDGQLYAVSGEVSIDTSPVDGDPRATLRKMDQVRKAALAPAQPSGQDRAVASAAASIQVNAQHEMTQQQMQQVSGTNTASPPPSPQPAQPTPAPASGPKAVKAESAGKTQAQPSAQPVEEQTQPAAAATNRKYKPLNLWT
jgi:hypothetical protein